MSNFGFGARQICGVASTRNHQGGVPKGVPLSLTFLFGRVQVQGLQLCALSLRDAPLSGRDLKIRGQIFPQHNPFAGTCPRCKFLNEGLPVADAKRRAKLLGSFALPSHRHYAAAASRLQPIRGLVALQITIQ